MAKAQHVDLKPNRLLLDSNFEGYKLSLESFPLKSVDLPRQVRNVRASETQWSLQQLKLFSEHNNLVVDFLSSHNDGVYMLFVVLEDLSIYGLSFEPARKLWSTAAKVVDVHVPTDFANRGDRFGVTIVFPSADLAVVSNGCGLLNLYSTANRSQFAPWKELLSIKPLKNGINGRAFVVVDAVAKSGAHIEVLLQAVVETPVAADEAHQKQSAFVTQLHWITLQDNDTDGWRLSRSREIETRGNVEFASFNRAGDNVILASTRKAVFVADSAKPIEQLEIAMETIDCDAAALAESQPNKIYSWTQSAEDVTVVFNLPDGVAKTDVQFSLTSDSVLLSVSGKSLLAGQLGGDAEIDSSTWIIEANKLELTLGKLDAGRMWSDVVVGDETGEYTADPELVREMSERLNQFTTESQELPGSGIKPLYNSQELEECDTLANDACFLTWLDDSNHAVVKESDLSGKQFLFTRRLGAQEPMSVCLRHDVDGVLWSFDFDEKLVEHRATFNAFGYVQASKQQRKYSTCAPDGSYSVIIDGAKHSYIYWQPTPLNTELRNRKNGKSVTSVAKQQLVTLPDVTEEIVGFHAADNCLFLLTRDKVIAAVLKEVRDFE